MVYSKEEIARYQGEFLLFQFLISLQSGYDK
jgi:hypothetical protein